jgi:single-strand DNA-binding protein
MSKGRPLLVEGRLKFDSWTAQDGGKRSKLSVVAENFQFIGGRGDGDGGGGGRGGAASRDDQRGAPGDYADDVGGAADDIPF